MATSDLMTSDSDAAGTKLYLFGEVQVADTRVQISGAYGGGDPRKQQWLLTGSVAAARGISVAGLLKELANPLGVGADFPAGLIPPIDITDVAVSYDTASKTSLLAIDAATSSHVSAARDKGAEAPADLQLLFLYEAAEDADNAQNSGAKTAIAAVAYTAPLSLSGAPEILQGILGSVSITDVLGAYASRSVDGFKIPGIAVTDMLTGKTTRVSAERTVSLEKGFALLATLEAPGFREQISLAMDGNASPTALGGDDSPSALAAAGPTAGPAGRTFSKWLTINKGFGPLSLQRLGFSFETGDPAKVAVLFDASLGLGPLTLGLEGLKLGFELDKLMQKDFVPEIGLSGLSVAYASGPVEIAGGLLKRDTEYIGEVLLQVGDFTFTCYGAYGKTPGKKPGEQHQALFVFLRINYPMGGPPAFFVTGAAGGFGNNMRFNPPPAQALGDFPLLAWAAPGAGLHDPLGALVTPYPGCTLPAISIDPGQDWVALGVMVTSYDLVDTSILAVVEWGDGLIVDLLGLSTLAAPKNADPIVFAQLGIRAVYDQKKGTLSVVGRLTPESYILDRSVRLTGGFALDFWFSPNRHDGDWVFSIGGYSPYFTKPAHYPSVPRLGFNWKKSDELTIKGNAYLALTPTCFMVGGYLKVTYGAGNLKAWMAVEANFLIDWQPFHYFIQASVSVGVSYRIKVWFIHKTITVHLGGVEVEMWGPSFGGKARIDVHVFTITIPFGDSNPDRHPTIPWSEFKTAFLPRQAGSPVQPYPVAQVTSGLVKTLQANSGKTPPEGAQPGPAPGPDGFSWIVNPHDFVLDTNLRIPIKAASFNGTAVALDGAETAFGVRPCGVEDGDFVSSFSVTLEWKTKGRWNHYNDVRYAPVLKTAPKGLWKKGADPMNRDDRGNVIEKVCYGLRFRPPVFHPDFTVDVDIKKLNFQLSHYLAEPFADKTEKDTVFPNGLKWQKPARLKTFTDTPWPDEKSSIDSQAAARTDILTALETEGCALPSAEEVTVDAAYGATLLAGPVYAGFGS